MKRILTLSIALAISAGSAFADTYNDGSWNKMASVYSPTQTAISTNQHNYTLNAYSITPTREIYSVTSTLQGDIAHKNSFVFAFDIKKNNHGETEYHADKVIFVDLLPYCDKQPDAVIGTKDAGREAITFVTQCPINAQNTDIKIVLTK